MSFGLSKYYMSLNRYAIFCKDKIDEENIGLILSRIERSNKIMDILVNQINVLESMSSLDFRFSPSFVSCI